MAANQNPNQQPIGAQQPNQQQQAQGPQQMPNGYNYPPPGYYPPQYNYPPCPPQQQAPREEGIGIWTALGLFGAGFLMGQLFSEPTPQQVPPSPQGVKLPWQK